MTEMTHDDDSTFVIPMVRSDLISVFLLGAGIGFLVWALGTLLDRYLFGAYFCQSDVGSQCGSSDNYAALMAGVVGGIVALAGLVRLRVYRPLLIVGASMLSAWGVAQISWDSSWPVGILTACLFYGLAFSTYSWIARIREFWIALVAILLLTAFVRFALMA